LYAMPSLGWDPCTFFPCILSFGLATSMMGPGFSRIQVFPDLLGGIYVLCRTCSPLFWMCGWPYPLSPPPRFSSRFPRILSCTGFGLLWFLGLFSLFWVSFRVPPGGFFFFFFCHPRFASKFLENFSSGPRHDPS